MNRPEFLLRQFRFYELTESPHPIYISDSSNEENAKKIRNGIKEFKKLNITYQWAPPGKDCVCQLLPLIKEQYSMQVCDDDIMIPKTISECADFLEEHPDYGTCLGKQINFYSKPEYYNKPYGIIERQTRPLGRSIEDENMLDRSQSLLAHPEPPFLCFSVRRIETEKAIRNVTKHFHPLEDMFEFLTLNMLVVVGKSKSINKLGYVMQRSISRYQDHGFMKDFLLFPGFVEKWKISEEGFSEFIHKMGVSHEKSIKTVRWIFLTLLANIYCTEINTPYIGQEGFIKRSTPARKGLFQAKKARHLISRLPFLKTVYYKFKPPYDVTRPESQYFNDYKTVKDFLENVF